MTHANLRWIAPSFAALVVGLSACGSAIVSGSEATDLSGSANPRTPQVIHVAGGAAAANGGTLAMATDALPNSKMRPIGTMTYQFNGTPPDLTGPAGSWFFSPDTAPTQQQIADIAAALNVSGGVTELAQDQGGGWRVGPADYSAATLSVSHDALFSWYYSPAPGAVAVAGGGCATASVATVDVAPAETSAEVQGTADDGTVDPAVDVPVGSIECTEPQPPSGILTADAAMAKAGELFTALGIDMSKYETEVYADAWSASVTAFLTLDDVRTSVAISAGFGAEGALTWASGFLGTPQRGGDYSRIGVSAAIERLNTQSVQWMGLDTGVRSLSSGSGGIAVAPSMAPAVEGTDAGEPSATPAIDPSQPVESPQVICDPITDTVGMASPCGTPDPVVVTLENVRPSLEQLWARDDTIWLLPGYAFDSTDGGIYSVIAVPDEFIQIDTPPVPEIGATDPAPAVEPAPDVEPTPDTTSDTTPVDTALVEPTPDTTPVTTPVTTP